jgi:hypothetical protein
MTAPTPVFKPRQPALALGAELCGGCQGIEAETPQALENRDGLSAIRYRIGDYADFRASLHAALSSSEFPRLDALRTRDESDFTIGLVDAFACAADVLTFYQERLANESYLRTAVERTSLQELGKLIGYRLRPGVAAETWLAFALETPPSPPPTVAPEPGSFVTGIPTKIALEAGIKVQSVPGPDEQPQIFETVEPLAEARPSWNALRPWFSEQGLPGRDATFTYLTGVRNNLKVGDALLFLGEAIQDNTGGDGPPAIGAPLSLAAAPAVSPTDHGADLAGFGEGVAAESGDIPVPAAPVKRVWNIRLLTSVELQPESSRTLVRWQLGLSKLLETQVFALRKRTAVFGHNAPDWNSLSGQFRRDYLGRRDNLGPDWPVDKFTLSRMVATSDGGFVDLDVTLPDVQSDSFAVLAKAASKDTSAAEELFDVVSVAEVSRADFGLSGKVTRLQLRGSGYEKFKQAVRDTTVLTASEPLKVAEYPISDPVSGDLLPVVLSAEGLPPNRRLIVRGTTSTGQTVAQQVTLEEVISPEPERSARSGAETHCHLRITPALNHTLIRDSVVVHANVALASHGETVSQILGTGNAASAFQRFALAQQPVTYRAAPNELGAKSELVVRVGDVAWRERPTLFGALPSERVYALATDEKGRTFAQFGDGVCGARLSSGVNNVLAQYRKGLGDQGNVSGGKLTQLLTRPLGLKSVENPLTAEGGTDPESAEAARQSVPLTARALGRVVSLLDYEDFARAFSGIAKAQAQVLELPAGATIAITIAAPSGTLLTPASPVWQNLLSALRKSGDPHVAVELLAYEPKTFELGLKLRLDPAYERSGVFGRVEAALRSHFGFDARNLSQPVQQSDVVATIHRVPGVVAVDLTTLDMTAPADGGGAPSPAAATPLNQRARLLAARTRVQGGVALPAELLTLAPGRLQQLEEMT